MKYQFFSIPAHAADAAQEALNRFCAEHRVIDIEKQFVTDGPKSYWAFCIYYQDASSGPISTRKNRIDYREVLNQSDFAVFAKLRHLRKNLAEQEGVPAYALFTNEQLAAMVQQRVSSKTSLAEIEGVGTGRIEKYGDAFLHLLSESLREQDSSG